MNKKIYDVSYKRLGLLMLPVRLRRDLVTSLMSALMSPLTMLHQDFMSFRNSIDMTVHSQVCYMERLLNDRYDYYERRIKVRDALINYDDFFLFSELSNKPTMLSREESREPVFMVRHGMLATTNVDFEVLFPLGYSMSDNQEKALKQLLNDNKLASKKYKIIYG